MSKTYVPSGIFESNNARFLRPEQVARTFVLSDHFDELSKRGHSLVVGPRGSGKTTLLKMLQGQALNFWKHPEASNYKERIDYAGVFIPTDVVWAKQIKNLGHEYLTDEQHTLLERAVFTTHILHELVQTMEYRLLYKNDDINIHGGVVTDEQQEIKLVKALSENWYLKPDICSLISLKQSIMKRIGEIFEIVSKEGFIDSNERDKRFSKIDYFHMNFLQETRTAIEVFADIYNRENQQWALLFDELELAPTNIVQYLIRSLRSSDQRIYFKLSFSPYNENIELLQNAWEAMPGHDFKYIKLWYPNKDEGTKWSKSLVASMLRERNAASTELTDIFGYSATENVNNPKKRRGGPEKESKKVKLFKKMYEDDRSFREYIVRNKIDLDNLHELSENERARWIRKIYPIAIVRNAYRKPDEKTSAQKNGRKVRRKSRKAYPSIYAGTKSMFDILEGNPRWIIGVIGPLLDTYLKTKRRIPPSKQLSEIKKAANQFKSLLSAIPCDVAPKGEPPKNVLTIIDMIGEYFSKVVTVHKFRPEPAGSFIVDPTTSKEFERALALALNAGAIVYCPGTTSNLIVKSLIDRRFRLSYLLAPNYHIPIQLMRITSISKVLKGRKSAQLSLFDAAGEGKND